MKIGVMLRHLGEQGGIGVYTENIVRSLLTVDQRNEYLLIYSKPDHLGRYAHLPNAREIVVSAPHKLWWDQVTIPRLVKRERLDLIFNPKLSIPLFPGCKSVWVMHGGAHFVVPHVYLWYDRLYFTIADRMYAKRASAVITPTRLGARDIARHMGADPAKIHVTPYAYNERCRMFDEDLTAVVRARLKLPERFMLFVGGIFPIKNFGNIVRAYARIHNQIAHKLVVVGFRRWGYSEDLQLIDELDQRDNVVFTDYLPDDELAAIYNLADVLVSPSLYEGFGIPALEAMASGCPVVTTKTGCVPEVVDGAALLVDPSNPQEIADAVHRALTDVPLREQLIQKGLQRVKEFSWERCARQTVAVFESLAPPLYASM
jgi:glycosyltransferase involved in cell wall biosynthesis